MAMAKMKSRAPVLTRKPGLYLKDTGHKGRGVFCRADVKKGETLEVSPALVLNDAATRHADETLLTNYTFIIGDVSKTLKKRLKIGKAGNASAAVFGTLTFCNHDENPNAEILWEEHEGTLYYSLRATRNIPKGTEICTSYGDTWFSERE